MSRSYRIALPEPDMMFGTLALISLMALLALAAPAFAAEPTPATGAVIYEENCAVCHGADGEGAMPGMPDLTEIDGPLSKLDEDLFQSVHEGVERPDLPTPMPPADLSHEEVVRVIKFMRNAFEAPQPK